VLRAFFVEQAQGELGRALKTEVAGPEIHRSALGPWTVTGASRDEAEPDHGDDSDRQYGIETHPRLIDAPESALERGRTRARWRLLGA
jgi:hypothetical protein